MKKHAIFLSRRTLLAALVISITALSGCTPSPESSSQQQAAAAIAKPALYVNEADAEILARQLWQQSFEKLNLVSEEAAQLQTTIKVLLNNTDEAALTKAQSQWQKVFVLYQELLPFLFIEHPLLSQTLANWRYQLAAWPLQPGYLDSYDVYIQSGIVNDINQAITVTLLRQQNGRTDIEEVVIGLYAIEYLLWGDKPRLSPKRFRSQSKVPLALEQAGLKISELPNNRRRLLLKLQAELFSGDLALLKDQWQQDGSIENSFSQLTTKEKLNALHRGLSKQLTEIETLLAYKVDINESGSNLQKSTYPDRFNNNRQQAISKQIAVIETLYFSSPLPDAAATKASLASALLSNTEQEQIKIKLADIKKQLTL